MVSKTVTFAGGQGFQMEAASAFSSAMANFNSTVQLRYNGGTYTAKSILNLVAAYIQNGSPIEVICSGDDEEDALAAAVRLLEDAAE